MFIGLSLLTSNLYLKFHLVDIEATDIHEILFSLFTIASFVHFI